MRDLVLAAIHALDDSIVGSIVGSAIVGSIAGSIAGSGISNSGLSLFLFFLFSVVDKSVVVGTMIYMPLMSFPERVQEDGKVMQHFPS